MTTYNTSNIISGLNVSVIKYVIGIFKDHSQKGHTQKNKRKETIENISKLCMRTLFLFVWCS